MSVSDETDRTRASLEAAHGWEAPEDARWEALSRGELSVEVTEALRREDPDRFELYRPFSDAEQERIVEGALARLALEEQARRLTRIVAVVAALVAIAIGAWLGTR